MAGKTPRMTQIDLMLEAEKGCRHPECTSDDCGPMVISPGCHLGRPVYAAFDKATGYVRIRCSVCGTEIVELVLGNLN